VIWSRPLGGATRIDGAAMNTLVLYHTVAPNGRDVAVSGAIAIPKGDAPPGGWPVISWAHGTTGNAPQCAPTRAGAADFERSYLAGWVTRGYAVVQTDYEGQGTPGLHPYLVGSAAAHDVTDIVRAARALYPAIGTRWFAFGHSEGGSAALFTAMLGQFWAPELTLEGAVSFAPPPHLAPFIYSLPERGDVTQSLPLILDMIEGVASSDPAIDLSDLLTHDALSRLPDLQQRCIDSLIDDKYWTSLPPSFVFKSKANIRPLALDFLKNDANRIVARVPILLLQGDADEIVSAPNTERARTDLCTSGNALTFYLLRGKTHGTVVTDSVDTQRRWVAGVTAGTSAIVKGNCP